MCSNACTQLLCTSTWCYCLSYNPNQFSAFITFYYGL